jgi:coenzyme F420-0:L-glutamate ligase / coenzyme F420-1:gamma-L-glutamate ligase
MTTRPPIITEAERAFVAGARQATLATTAPNGRPRLVPVCFVLAPGFDAVGRARLYTPLDEKPKRTDDLRQLARVRDLLVLPQATLLIDRWDEDWTRLGWVRLYGTGEILEPEPREVEEHAAAVAALRAKYPQYDAHGLGGRPIIRIAIDRALSWGELGGGGGPETPG